MLKKVKKTNVMLQAKLKILHLEDTPSDAELVERELTKRNIQFEILVVDNKKAFEKALIAFIPDLILSDHTLPSFDSIEAIKIIKEQALKIPFILVTSTVSDEYAVEVMKAGANDYILKDRLHRLPQAILNAMEINNAESNLQAIFEATSEGFILVDTTGIIKTFNTISAQTVLLNTEKELKVGTSIYAFMHLSRTAFYNDVVKQVLSGTKVQYDLSFERKNGVLKWFSYTINPVYNKAKEIEGVCITSADITERKKVEKQIINYKSAIEQSSIVVITDEHGIINYVNDNFCTISQYKSTELIGQNHSIVYSGNHSKFFLKSLWSRISSGKIWKGEVKNKAKDGTSYWVDATIVPFIDQKGKPYQYMSIQSDITNRKKAEHKLHESETFNKGVLSALSSHIAVIDLNGNLLAVNDAWNDFGTENGVTSLNRISVGSNYFDECKRSIASGNQDAVKALAGIESIIRKENKQFDMEYACHIPNLKRWFSLSVKNFGIDGDQIMIAHHDITFKKLAELSLQLSQSNLMALIENTDAIIYSLNTQLQYITYNKQLSTTLKQKYDLEISIGDSINRVLDQLTLSEATDWKKVYAQALNGDTVKFEKEYSDGEQYLCYSFSVNPIWENETIVGLSCFVYDVTQQKEQQHEKEKMTADLMQRNRNLEQFAFIISHNLRAPAANIIGCAENLKEESLTPEEQKELLQGLYTSAIGLDTIIKDINKVLQLKSEINTEKEVIVFSQLLTDIKGTISALINEHQVCILSDFSEVEEIYSLKVYIYSIFFNLIVNSIKYAKPTQPPQIEIKSSKKNNTFTLTFKDNGLGLDMKTQGAKIFGLYKRFHSHVDGKGLGLFMVKTQVESLGGTITVESQLHIGTEFTIVFKI